MSVIPDRYLPVFDRLGWFYPTGDGWNARCPAHEDHRPSLHLWLREGRLMLYCYAGCHLTDILMRLGLTMKDINPERPAKFNIECAYSYKDEQGRELFQVVRLFPKSFRQRHMVGSEWVWSMKGVRRVLYRLPDILKYTPRGHPVVVVEGEKDADACWKHGIVATTSPGGAGKWRREYSESLTGAAVIVVADDDKQGRGHAQQVAESVWKYAKMVKVMQMPGEGVKDFSDWAAGRNGSTSRHFFDLSKDTPTWNPLRGCFQEIESAIRDGNRAEILAELERLEGLCK